MLALVFALAVFFPASAMAAKGLGTGVHVDPSSPAAKEYQIPLGAARGNGQSGSSAPSSLFGQGITPASTTSSDTATAANGASGNHRHGTTNRQRHRASSGRRQAVGGAGRPGGGTGAGSSAASTPSPAHEIGTGSGGGTGITWMLGAAVAVLLLGGLGGSFLARRDRRARRPSQAGRTSPYVS